jgi:prepilin-type N-terminal cleavage/methylation domain-containing protein
MADRPEVRQSRRELAHEGGFTLIELLVAISVMVVGLAALVSSFDHSRELVSVAEKTEVASHRAERELERILALPYESVAHTSTPVDSADPDSPASFVSGAAYQWDQGSTGPQSDDMVVDGAGLLGPGPTTWQDSETRLSGEVHRFVTWTGDFCTAADRSRCSKRVTVAVTVGGPRPLGRAVLTSTIMIDPAATGGV